MDANDLILYTSDDGEAQLVLRVLDGQVWLTQLEMAEPVPNQQTEHQLACAERPR